MVEAEFVQVSPASEETQLDDDSDMNQVSAKILDQPRCGSNCASRGQDVIDDEDLGTRLDGVLVHSQGVLAVFQIEGLGIDVTRQFARFAHWYEAHAQAQGHRSGEHEPPGFHTDDDIDPRRCQINQSIDTGTISRRAAQERSDVLEDHTRMWEIGNIPDVRRDQFDSLIGNGHYFPLWARLVLTGWRRV